MVLLSYVVPMFCVEKYVINCLDSIYNLHVNADNFEVICVDDCSDDLSVETVKKYIEEKDISNCILVSNKCNMGLSYSRNIGAQHAKGEYLFFLDADDFLAPSEYAKVIRLLEKHEYDIVEINCEEYFEGGSIVYESSLKKLSAFSEDSGSQYLRKKIALGEYYAMAVTKIVKKSCFDKSGGFFPNIYFEDEDYTPRLYLNANKCVTVNVPVYVYRRRSGSITTTVFSRDIKWIDSYVCVINRMIALSREEIAIDVKQLLYDRACTVILSLIKNCAFYNVDDEITESAIDAIKSQQYTKYFHNAGSWLLKAQGVFLYCPHLFFRLIRIYYKYKSIKERKNYGKI